MTNEKELEAMTATEFEAFAKAVLKLADKCETLEELREALKEVFKES